MGRCTIQLTEATESNEASNHEHRMQVELVFGILSPCEASAVIQHPEQRQGERSQQEQTSQHHHQHVFKPVGACPLVFIFVATMSGTRQKGTS